MSRSIRRAMIDRDHQQLSLVRQCILLDVSRASVYYRSVPTRAEDLELMALMDRQYLKTPFYGSRKMKAWLLQQGYLVSRKRVRRLMRLMGLEAIYRRPNTSKPAPGHRIFPYLLKGVEVNRVGQVWAADITYIPMAKGFLYLVAIMDWHSRHVLAWNQILRHQRRHDLAQQFIQSFLVLHPKVRQQMVIYRHSPAQPTERVVLPTQPVQLPGAAHPLHGGVHPDRQQHLTWISR